MYEIFEKLCARDGITPYKFCKDMGVSTSTISTWKKKNSQCIPELAEKVCEYFKISHDYLMTGKELSTEKPPIPNYDRDTLEMIKLFSQLNKEQKNSILSMMRSFALTN